MYPEDVVINSENIKKLTSILKTTYKAVVSEIADATDFGVKNRKQILAQIRKILEDAGEDFDKFIRDELPDYYKLGIADATKQLNNVGAELPVATNFATVHKQTIMALIDDTNRAFAESLTGVGRSANVLLGKATREALTQNLVKGITAGEALRQVKNTIKTTLQEQGLGALIDKGGKTWQLDTYAEMLFRTKAVEARNRGLINRVVENGYDLVEVSSHPTSCELCAPWQGKILSSTGATRGYPTVREAESDGLFHPNCRHAINVLIPRLARLTSGYDLDVPTKVIEQPKQKTAPITIGTGKNQVVINDIKQSEVDFIKARNLTIETMVSSTKYGSYQMNPNNGENKIRMALSAIKKTYPNEKAYIEAVKSTFYHEYGHFIDARYANKTIGGGAYYGVGNLTKDAKVRDLISPKSDEGKAILLTRLKRTFSGNYWDNWDMTDDKIEDLVNYKTVVLKNAKTGVEHTYKIPASNIVYYKSDKEMYADAYSQYRVNKDFRKYAPKVAEYFDELIKNLPTE